MSLLEWIAVGITLLAVYLTTRQIVWCWPLGMVSVSLYAVVFFEARLYADMGLQVLYFGLSAYGWWAWRHGGQAHGELSVSRLSRQMRWLLACAAASAGLGLGFLLDARTNASLPYLDSLLTAFSVAAQWMQARKYLEAWLVWLIVDVFYVGMFLFKGLYPTAFLYTVFLALAVLGLVKWRRSMRANDLTLASEVAG